MPPSQHPAPGAMNPWRAGTPTEGQMGHSMLVKLTNQVAHKTQDTSCSLMAEPTGSGSLLSVWVLGTIPGSVVTCTLEPPA